MNTIYPASGVLNSLKVISNSLTGLVSQAYNAQLTFITYSGQTIYDEWGNPSLDTQTTITLTAKLEETKPQETIENPGVDVNMFFYEGYLVNPLVYTFPLPKKIDAQFLYQGTWRAGEFFPVNIFATPLTEAIEARAFLGQKISGWLRLLEGY
jgi:hypothetical protein